MIQKPTKRAVKQRKITIPDEKLHKLFDMQSANNWLKAEKKLTSPKMLFDTFWFEGELCILFADTNAGKSILAVQIGECIAKGLAIDSFKVETEPCTVIYFDFEQDVKQFNARYSCGSSKHTFSKRFYRAELKLNIDGEPPLNKNQIHQYLEAAVINLKAKVLIIDNLTYLQHDTERSISALLLMKNLKALKVKYGLSILVLAHTPKRNPVKHITQNDLQGSKMLMNFCDSAFAIGQSHADPDLRYLKQIKQRNSILDYGADNICICKIVKPGNFLKFEFIEHDWENYHLRRKEYADVKAMKESIIELHKRGFPQRRISARLGIGKSSVSRLLLQAVNEGLVAK